MIYVDIEKLESFRHQCDLDFSGPKYYGQALQNSKRRAKKRRSKKNKHK